MFSSIGLSIIFISILIGLYVSLRNVNLIQKLQITPDRILNHNKNNNKNNDDDDDDYIDEDDNLLSLKESYVNKGGIEKIFNKLQVISKAISDGAHSFLKTMYKHMTVFMLIFSIIIFMLISIFHHGESANLAKSTIGGLTAFAFLVGAITSCLAGYIGMSIAVKCNVQTTIETNLSLNRGFVMAFRGGSVMGFSLVSIGLLNLMLIIVIFNKFFFHNANQDAKVAKVMYETLAGYGLGGSSIALFGRVGGGIYTKAADVGADLSGKVEQGIPEDDPRNPAVIADNVGDNVGDVAGMGADLFGSFGESLCASLVLSSQSDLYKSENAMIFPLVILAAGLIVSIFTSFLATHAVNVSKHSEIEPALKMQLFVSTVIMTPTLFILTSTFLPHTFNLADIKNVKNWYVFICISAGLWCGLAIGLVTEYYTSHRFFPVRELAGSCRSGPATNIIYGLSLGYLSLVIPIILMCLTIYISLYLCGLYGVAMSALGILSTMATGLTIDAFGPICDNAGGLAEMSGSPERIRENTDALDAAGNTTAAIGKGFAIGSAAFVSFALFGAFVSVTEQKSLNVLKPKQFCGLLFGAMLPYWFSAMTIKSVGVAALAMVEEVRRQLKADPEIMKGNSSPDYEECVKISTDASIKEMRAPGLLVLGTPLIAGYLFGVETVSGILCGSLVSSVQMAISASNSGGAWDNAKKYISSHKNSIEIPDVTIEEDYNMSADEREEFYKQLKEAAIIGDTVGDPLKDTSGPSLNILLKLAAITALVFAISFPKKSFILK